MKKAVSLLASFALAFSLFGAPVLSFADDGLDLEDEGLTLEDEGITLEDEGIAVEQGIVLASAERDDAMLEYLEDLDENEFTAVAAPGTGAVEVKLTTSLVDPLSSGGLTATLATSPEKTAAFVAKDDNGLSENGYVAKIEGVAPGSYTLVVEGPGFATFAQSGVVVEAGKRGVVELTDHYANLMCSCDLHKGTGVLVDQCAGRGLIPYGSWNGDSAIDNADAKVLLQAIARVRGNVSTSDDEYAKFGLNLVRDIVSADDTGAIDRARSVESGTDETAEQSAEVAMPEGLDIFSEIQIVSNASGEDANVEAAGQPEFLVANATEDTELVATERALAAAEEQEEEAAEDEVAPGTVERVKHTEPVAVGLNAFQALATLRTSQVASADLSLKSETSHMQVVASEDTDVVLDPGKSLEDVIFNDNGDIVKMYPMSDATISEDNPVQLTINAQGSTMGAVSIAVPSDSPNAPTAGQVIVQRADNPSELITCDFVAADTQNHIAAVMDMRSNLYAAAGASRLAYAADDNAAAPQASVNEAAGTITIDLKGQIPVKTITIKVTSTSSKKLAEIAQVEFLNDMQHSIPAPELDIPKNLKVTSTGNKSISLAWDPQRNITGYELEVSYNGSASVIYTVKNSASVKSFAGKELVNYRTYTLRARSVNGDWRSPWSASVEATPQANGVPKKPAAPRVSGGYDSINVSWSMAEDAETTNVYYRKQGESTFTKAADKTTATKLTIPNLERETTYDVYIEGVNRKGVGPKSDVVSAKTTPDKVKVPWYKLLNREVINKEKGTSFASVIEKVEGDNGTAGGDPNNMVDGDYNTYYSGAKGGYYHGGTVTFKQPYDMDTIILTGYQGQSLNIYDLVVQAWDANNQPIKPSGGNIKKSVMNYSSKTRTVMIRTEKLEGVKKIRVAYQRAVGTSWSASTIAELAFYDSTLYSDVMAVWADDEHTRLVDGMTEQKLLDLQTTVNTPDVINTSSGAVSEDHPSKSVLLAELDNALIVCRNGGLRAPIKVDGNLNTVGAKRGVGGLNGWQPLGVAAAAGDEIAVYVGRKGETSGDVPLAIYVVQNHPDLSNGFSARLDTSDNRVKVGLNTFRIPENLTSINMERGGSLYVEYATGRGNNEQYTVRVSGGTEIPLLDIHNVTNADQRMNLIRQYVQSIKTYDPAAAHNAKGHVTPPNDTAYHAQDCIANATDIVLKDMMYSIPVSQVAANIGVNANSTADQVEAAAQKLAKSLTAMDDMMTLFYQHKGFVKDSSAASKYGANNAWPTLHQNIRYVRCSGGTFMYAAGNHIGVQWGSVGGLVASPGVVAEDGKWQSGSYFGWGVAHEVGHEINNGAYTYAEVTNNYYSQLAQATDNVSNPKTRWGTYDSIYSRVASGAKGMSLGKTGIAMYWQLHLAYDDGYNFKTYAKASDQLDNLVFARMDAYARNVSAAPKAATNGHALTMSGADRDNAIMRLACAATQKNLLDFFQAWGLTPNAETRAYAEQWPEETRAIQYQTDALRLFRIGDLSQLSEYGVTTNQIGDAAARASVNASLVYEPIANRPNTTEQQSIAVSLTGATVSSDILGYEVLRNGTVVGFLRANAFEGCPSKFTGSSATFVDTINTVNNRVFKYEVRAVDKLLNRGELVPAGEVKVSHKNSLAKTKWTATTNMTSGSTLPNETHTVTATVGGEAVVYDAEEYADDIDRTVDHPVANAIDGSVATVFVGTVPADSGETDARITIDFSEPLTVVGIRVKGAPAGASYRVETSLDGTTWDTIPLATIEGDDAIYFAREADEYLYGHDAAYLRLTMPGQTSFSANEIDVLGPQGDDAEFLANGIGLLSQTEKLGTNESGIEATIPADSLVFVGTYKGNPAYNALLLYDQKGNILGGVGDDGAIHAKEVIFAPPVADGALLGDVKEGYWVYYIEPQYLPSDWKSQITSVKAELYRVDDAHTLEGQRLVADTLSVPIPSDLSKIDLSFGQVKTPEPKQADEQAEQQEQSATDLAAQEQQAAEELIESGSVSGYSYDLAEMYGNAPGANEAQSGAAGTPIYGTIIDDSSVMGTPMYDTMDPSLGTPIYDNATPLASPTQGNNSLTRVTLKSLRETLIETLKQIDAANITRNLG